MNSREGLATSSRPMLTRFLCPPLQGAGGGLGTAARGVVHVLLVS